MTPGRTTRMERSSVIGAGLGSGASTSGEERKKPGETIHSGQFMVSHFETEGQEDEDDDDLGMQVVVEDVKPAIVDTVISNIISKRNPELSMETANLIASSSNAIVPLRSGTTGMELIKYAQKRQPLQLTSRHTSSQVEIDTDLSTVFNTLNVTYTQKLTSPKWNPFKGIRLRWKEKIRLNNVIWRCWHMQFIMKRKTLVCQFASPLDVDVHNTPQAILLEGKYWKRKCNVIKAEYKKWRRFYVNKALGANNIIDTTNSREIARGAGRADFIQPSLGPLQPNFDDLMDLDLDFLNFSRLAPVPEEGSEDILKAIEYNYPGSSNQINSGSNIQEITDSPGNTNQQASSQLIPPRTAGSGNSVITGPGTSVSINQQQQSSVPSIIVPSTIQYSAKVFAQGVSDTTAAVSSVIAAQQQQQLSNAIGNYLSAQLGQQTAIITANVPLVVSSGDNVRSVAAATDDVSKDTKPRFSRSFPRHLGREPHNYDKCPPTSHQTMAYNLVSQPQMEPNMLNNPYPPGSYQMQPGGIIQMSGTPDNQNLLTYNIQQPQPISSAANAMNLSSSTVAGTSNPNLMMQNINSKLLTHSQSLPVQNQPNNQKPQPRSISMPTAPNYPPMLAPQQSPPGSILQQHQQDAFKGSLHPQTSSYKSYHSHQPQPYKIPSQNTLSYGSSGRSMRHSSPPHGHQQQGVNLNQQPTIEQSQQQLQDLQLQQQQQSSSQSQQKRLPPHPTKEMFRSNSLPINATFPLPPKEENFAVPRYQAKPSPKLRMRSNSMIIKQPGGSSMAPISGANLLPSLHATSSEPVLNMGNSALLAQLLTTNNTSTLFNIKQQPTTSSAISNLQTSQQQSHQAIAQQHHHNQQQQQHQHQQQQQQQQQSTYQQPPLGSPISPNSSQLHLNQPQLSPQQQPHTSAQAQNSVLSFASTSSYSGISIPNQCLSPELMLDSDTPMSPVGMASGLRESSIASPSTGSGVGNKFHQQQQHRSEHQRRTGHIHAEQKRRYNIKNGFDMLHSLIPQLQQNPNAKLSKAAMLQKGAEYIKQLRSERSTINEKMEELRREIETLNNSLSNLQTSLPASGAPVSRQRTGRVNELYQQYVRQRTMENWKFWIFGLIFEPLMNTFNQTVSVASLDEMCRSCQLWVDQHCSLVELRPAVSNKLRQLSTTTDILSDPPTSLQEEVLKAMASAQPLPGSSGAPTAGSSSHSGSNANSPNPPSGGF
ncbi:protein WBSCR14 homolog isoform X2 [Aedes aegypti]|uniref:Uncharacterized protein n=1 Tax=Aedes aegypti TaxID=7159 RepID=A0A6I8TFD4_AEDAE|nr:protein WBSCR14 homolog isoform X2 [Aedes aegypti]